MPTRLHGTGVRTDYPTPRVAPREEPAPKKVKSAALATYEAASSKNTLKDVSPARAKSLEKAFQSSSAKQEDLSGGRAGASIQGLVVKGELFVRTKAVRPGATPKWASAGPLKDAPKPKSTERTTPKGWEPKTPSLEARVQKVVADRMGMMSMPGMALNAAETAEMKKAIANGEFEKVNASPKGLAGASLTGYVQDNVLIVEKKSVAPGAKPAFFYLGPIN